MLWYFQHKTLYSCDHKELNSMLYFVVRVFILVHWAVPNSPGLSLCWVARNYNWNWIIYTLHILLSLTLPIFPVVHIHLKYLPKNAQLLLDSQGSAPTAWLICFNVHFLPHYAPLLLYQLFYLYTMRSCTCF